MPTLHDAAYRSAIVKRVGELGPDSQRRWGKMSVDQMLWHVNTALASALGEVQVPQQSSPLPRPLMKFLVLNMPWGKGAPTMSTFIAGDRYDFDAERVRCLRLIDALAGTHLDGEWPRHPMFGRISGSEVSRLHAKHLNHHLRQFGV